jgi:alpha-glucosidase
MRLPTLLLLAWFAVVTHAEVTPTVITGVNGSRLRLEAIDEGIVRIWRKPADADFAREASLATATRPTELHPLAIREQSGRVVAETAALRVIVDARSLTFDVQEIHGTPLLERAELLATASGEWTLSHVIAPGEHLLGLGQDNHHGGRLDRRGVIRELWAGQQINSGNVTAEYPVPLLLSTGRDGQAYGVFFDNVHRLRFDLGHTQPDHVRVQADGGETDLYVIAGPRLTDVIERYTRLTGRPSLPPLWALGYWQSRCTYYDWNALDEAYQQLDSRGFPVDVMVIDADWPEMVTDYVWAKRWIDTARPLDPAGKIADYAKRGVRIVMSQSGPMVRQDSPTFASGWAAGVFATDGHGNPVECGYYGGKLLDFTHPKLNDWLWPQTRRLNEQGVAGWWLDLTEPEGEPPQTHYFAGRPTNVHNEFATRCTLSFEGVQLAVHPQQRPFILNRAGSAGMQRHHAAVWTGDIYSDYATLRAHPPEMLNSGLSGFVYWTCDTGGFLTGYYKDDQMGAHARLYERWMQFSVFSPITRAHKAGGAPEPYQFGPAVEQSTRHYLNLRYRLLPYIYSYAWQASETGLPLVRPLLLEYPADAGSLAALNDEYLFGRELLVAPVLFEGQSNRRVYFPPGEWIDWDYGYTYAGGREWVVAAPQNRIPVAVRAGAIIPMAPAMKHTAEKPWDPLTLEVFPSGHSIFTMYQDDGATFAYLRGESTTTEFACDESADRVRLAISPSNARFGPKQYVARFHLNRAPSRVTVDGLPVQFDSTGAARPSSRQGRPRDKGVASPPNPPAVPSASARWDADARVLSLPIVSRKGARQSVEVALTGAPLPARVAPELKADAIDPKTEATGSAGKPVPHFFPPPTLPARVQAANYDNGGEGVAFHSTRPLPDKPLYRSDDFSLRETADAGGGFVLANLRAGEWARYTIDCDGGGFFDLSLRFAAARAGGRLRLVALDRTLADVAVPVTGGDDVWQEITVPGVYLNPGELSLMLFVEAPGWSVNTIAFVRTARPARRYPAVFAARAGVTEVEMHGGSELQGAVRNLGRIGSRLTWGIVSPDAQDATLRLRYQNSTGKPLPYSLKVGAGDARPLLLPATNGDWRDFDVKARLSPGANVVSLAGLVDGWDAVTVEWIELRP